MPVSCCPIWLLTACNVQPATACREDLEQLPPEADLDAYAAMPVEQFGMALLRCARQLVVYILPFKSLAWRCCGAPQQLVANGRGSALSVG